MCLSVCVCVSVSVSGFGDYVLNNSGAGADLKLISAEFLLG